MRDRAIKALLIAIGILAVMWVGLPILYPHIAMSLLARDELSWTPDGRYLRTARIAGVHSSSLYPEPENQARGTHSMYPPRLPTTQRAVLPWMQPLSKYADADEVDVVACGWPQPMFRRVTHEWYHTTEPTPYYNGEHGRLLYRFHGRLVTSVAYFPVAPIWSGLAINLIFWWLLAFGLLSLPLRPWLRRRKGKCPKCAYDLKQDFAAGCPECGWGRDAVSEPAPSASEGVLAQSES